MGLFVNSCNKDDTAERWKKEEADLAVWISENAPNASSVTINNVVIYYEIIGQRQEDNRTPVPPSDHVLVNFVCRFIDDGTVERVSFRSDQTHHNPLLLSRYKKGGPELWDSDYWRLRGVGQMHENETANIYIPSRILGLRDFRTRKYEIELVQVIVGLEQYQEDLMHKFMVKNFCGEFNTDTIPINGRDHIIFYHIDNKNSSDEGVNISTVRTRFNEFYFLQNNIRHECVRNQSKIGWDRSDRNLIKEGWDKNRFYKMFQSAKRGSKITAVMPYIVMYGEKDYIDPNTRQFIAPPGSVLKYEIFIDP